jgi:Fur family transcriptional regulator, ferric uptake regulator
MPKLDGKGAVMVEQRSTRQAAAVRAALARREGFASAQDLHAELRGTGAAVGLTTVYRHLQSLADAGAVDVLRSPDGESVYRICGSEQHHHHLVCRSCRRAVEIEGREVERWTRQVAEAEGFVDIDHTVEIIGTCRDCATHPRAQRTTDELTR